MNYEDNFKNELKQSREFVNYWIGVINRKMCWKLTPVDSSKLQQTQLCDTQEGFEFKWDKKFEDTGNFWIEIEEKHHPDQEKYIPSGILRDDNTVFYCIGNFNILYFVPKRTLLTAYNSGKWTIRENNQKTSKGFLVSRINIQMWSVFELTTNANDEHEIQIAL